MKKASLGIVAATVASSLKLTPVQQGTQKLDLLNEARMSSATLNSAVDKISTVEVNSGEDLLESTEIHRLLSMIKRWSVIEERLLIGSSPEILHQLKSFEDVIHNVASAKALLGHIFLRSNQADKALNELETSCPLLWKYKSSWRSLENDGWLDCYASLGDLYLKSGRQNEAFAVEKELLQSLPWLSSIITSETSTQDNFASLELKDLNKLMKLSPQDRKLISIEIKSAWALAEGIRDSFKVLVDDFLKSDSHRIQLNIFLRAQKVTEEILEQYATSSIDGSSTSNIKSVDVTTIKIDLKRLRDLLFKEISQEVNVYLTLMGGVVEHGETFLKDGEALKGIEREATEGLGFKSAHYILNTFEQSLVRLNEENDNLRTHSEDENTRESTRKYSTFSTDEETSTKKSKSRSNSRENRRNKRINGKGKNSETKKKWFNIMMNYLHYVSSFLTIVTILSTAVGHLFRRMEINTKLHKNHNIHNSRLFTGRRTSTSNNSTKTNNIGSSTGSGVTVNQPSGVMDKIKKLFQKLIVALKTELGIHDLTLYNVLLALLEDFKLFWIEVFVKFTTIISAAFHVLLKLRSFFSNNRVKKETWNLLETQVPSLKPSSEVFGVTFGPLDSESVEEETLTEIKISRGSKKTSDKTKKSKKKTKTFSNNTIKQVASPEIVDHTVNEVLIVEEDEIQTNAEVIADNCKLDTNKFEETFEHGFGEAKTSASPSPCLEDESNPTTTIDPAFLEMSPEIFRFNSDDSVGVINFHDFNDDDEGWLPAPSQTRHRNNIEVRKEQKPQSFKGKHSSDSPKHQVKPNHTRRPRVEHNAATQEVLVQGLRGVLKLSPKRSTDKPFFKSSSPEQPIKTQKIPYPPKTDTQGTVEKVINTNIVPLATEVKVDRPREKLNYSKALVLNLSAEELEEQRRLQEEQQQKILQQKQEKMKQNGPKSSKSKNPLKHITNANHRLNKPGQPYIANTGLEAKRNGFSNPSHQNPIDVSLRKPRKTSNSTNTTPPDDAEYSSLSDTDSGTGGVSEKPPHGYQDGQSPFLIPPHHSQMGGPEMEMPIPGVPPFFNGYPMMSPFFHPHMMAPQFSPNEAMSMHNMDPNMPSMEWPAYPQGVGFANDAFGVGLSATPQPDHMGVTTSESMEETVEGVQPMVPFFSPFMGPNGMMHPMTMEEAAVQEQLVRQHSQSFSSCNMEFVMPVPGGALGSPHLMMPYSPVGTPFEFFTPMEVGVASNSNDVQRNFSPGLEGFDLLEAIRKQIEYYFSMDNLQRDTYLKSKMDDEGFVLLGEIAKFRRISCLRPSPQMILDAVCNSSLLEVVGGDNSMDLNSTKIRNLENPTQWIKTQSISGEEASSPSVPIAPMLSIGSDAENHERLL